MSKPLSINVQEMDWVLYLFHFSCSFNDTEPWFYLSLIYLHQPLSKEKSRRADSCFKTVFNLLSNNMQYTCISSSCPFSWTISITVLINSMECKNRKDYNRLISLHFQIMDSSQFINRKRVHMRTTVDIYITVTILLSKLKRKSKSKILLL